jgi:hypothetical protein
MQSGKRLTLKDYFAKHTRTPLLVHTRIIKIQMLNCYCQLSRSVIFRQYGVSQSECKIDWPRPGLPRVSPLPHTEALGTRLSKVITIARVVTLELSRPRASQRLIWFIHQVGIVLLWETSTLMQWRHRTRSGDARASLGKMWQVTRPVSITIWESWTIMYLELFVVLGSRPIIVDCCSII